MRDGVRPAPAWRRALVLLVAVVLLALLAWRLPVGAMTLRVLEVAREAGVAGGVAYAGAYVLACVLMIPGSLLTAGAGFLWGTLGGLVVVIPGAVLGATAAFLVARTFGRGFVASRLAGSARFAAIDRAVARNGFRTVLLLRLSPVLPFNLLNYALGLTSVRLRDYVMASALGMLPMTVLIVRAGALITDAARLPDAAPTGPVRIALVVGGVLVLIVVVALLTRAARRALADDLAREPGVGGSA